MPIICKHIARGAGYGVIGNARSDLTKLVIAGEANKQTVIRMNPDVAS